MSSPSAGSAKRCARTEIVQPPSRSPSALCNGPRRSQILARICRSEPQIVASGRTQLHTWPEAKSTNVGHFGRSQVLICVSGKWGGWDSNPPPTDYESRRQVNWDLMNRCDYVPRRVLILAGRNIGRACRDQAAEAGERWAAPSQVRFSRRRRLSPRSSWTGPGQMIAFICEHKDRRVDSDLLESLLGSRCVTKCHRHRTQDVAAVARPCRATASEHTNEVSL